jgi:hypothetical protein
MAGKHSKNHETDHAEKQHGEEKLHGDPLEEAVSSAGEHDSGERNSERSSERNSAIPDADNGGHARSAAAHLGGNVHGHTKPTGDQRGIIKAEEFPREPPREVGRVGKDHRRQ